MMLRFFVTLAFITLLHIPENYACGYNFVGDCSSRISLSINGTIDSFAVATCPGVLQFDGFTLGRLQSLHLSRATGVTWESCQNNVSGLSLFYRVYEQGLPAGGWQSFSLEEDYNTLDGPYTTRYRSHNTDIDLTNGLAAGKTYVLEVYYLAEVDTVGDDFIPETGLLLNNNGQNYHFTFGYDGPAAPPFAVAVTKNIGVRCNGESNGVAGVSVYGNQNGLFYQWSTGGNNFPILTNLGAGTYSVTVTGSGHTESDTIDIAEPQPLITQFFPVAGVGCGGLPGEATAVPSGGTSPYAYVWANGQGTATATFVNAGMYAVTVTDAHACSAVYSLDIPAQPVVTISANVEICSGEVFSVGGLEFDQSGYFELNLPGLNGGCDTVLQLSLHVLNPAAAFATLPDTALITCLAPVANLCAAPVAGTSYQWAVNGTVVSSSLCLLTSPGAAYALTASTAGQTKVCTATMVIPQEEHITLPSLSASGTLSFLSNCYEADTAVFILSATSNAQGASFKWYLDGQLVSAADTCTAMSTAFNYPDINAPVVFVTDQYGCQNGPVSALLDVTGPPEPPDFFMEQSPDFCLQMVDVTQSISGSQSPYSVQWNGETVAADSFSLPPGQYQVVITDAAGCSTVFQTTLAPLYTTSVEHVPYGDSIGGVAGVFVNGDPEAFTYLWSTGDTTFGITNLGPGQFCVTVTEMATGCSTTTCLTILVPVDDPGFQPLMLSPNPAEAGGWVVAGLQEKIIANEWTAEILDVQGKSLRSLPFQIEGNRWRFRVPDDMLPGFVAVCLHDQSGNILVGKLLLR